MALITDIADAVAAELNGHDFGQPLEARRAYRPGFELADLRQLRVSVVPRAISITPAMRSANQHEIAIDIAVQRKVTGPEDPALDGLVDLVERIADFLRLRRLSMYPQAAWARTENSPIYAVEHLDQHSTFTSVLTLTWRVVR